MIAHPESAVEVVVDLGDLCGEAPRWDPESHCLYWSDCSGLHFRRYDPATGAGRTVSSGIEINGMALNHAGGFVITNNSGAWIWDGLDLPRHLTPEPEGIALRLNDGIADPKGRLITGSWFYDPVKPFERGKLLRIDPDGALHVLDEGFLLSNGLAFSPNGHSLYFADSAARVIYCYDYAPETGEAQNRRALVRLPGTEGLPDGLAVDAEGFLWAALWYGSCIVRLDPDGALERRIAIPAKQPSAIAFGGTRLEEIFVTTAGRSEAVPLMPPGYDPDRGFFGGALYRIRSGCVGKPDYRTSFPI